MSFDFQRLCFSVATKHVDNLMLVEFLHQVTCRTAVFTWIELTRFLSKYFTNGCCESQTAIRVDIDLANSTLGCLAQLLLWDADGSLQRATIFIITLTGPLLP